MAWGAASGLEPAQMGLKPGLFVTVFFPILFVLGIVFLKHLKQQWVPAQVDAPALQAESI